MAILGAAVVVTAALCVLDLLLTFGVIRRLRQQAELSGGSAVPGPRVIGLAAGQPVAAFSVRALDGELVTGASGVRVAGFFAAGCSACPERVGPFTEYLASHRVPPENQLAVVVAPDGEPPGYVGRLGAAGRVCVVREDSDVLAAFRVSGFPAFCLLDADGAVVAAGYDPARLPAPVTVA